MINTTHLAKSASGSPAPLWASAFVLFALIIVQAGRTTGTAAHADEAKARGLSVATINNNNSEEILAVLDDQLGQFFLYRVAPGPQLEVLEVRPVAALFRE